MKYFRSSIIITLIGFAVAFVFLGGFSALYVVILLSILEITLSFDNAIVNAKVLETMSPVWQQRFILYGIPIAVFGMRFVFPIVIVAVAGGLGVVDTFFMALNDPHEYHKTLEGAGQYIYAFGGAFLLMVFLDFLFDENREIKWFKPLECNRFIRKIAYAQHTETIIATVIGLALIYNVDLEVSRGIALAYFTGILLHSLIITFDELLSTNGVRSGVMGFLYLEVLDASFSFDGVIGAFALSSDVFIIMIGLGIGAMFVRSLTLYMVAKKTLNQYKYLEHGAHYAIVALAIIMFVKIFTSHINEIVVGTIGILFVGLAIAHSMWEKRKGIIEDEGCNC